MGRAKTPPFFGAQGKPRLTHLLLGLLHLPVCASEEPVSPPAYLMRGIRASNNTGEGGVIVCHGPRSTRIIGGDTDLIIREGFFWAAGGGGAKRQVGMRRGTLALRDVATWRCGRARCHERMVGVNGAKRLGIFLCCHQSALNGWDGFTQDPGWQSTQKARPVDCGAVNAANWPLWCAAPGIERCNPPICSPLRASIR